MIDSFVSNNTKIVITSDVPMITCGVCGKEFPSRGKVDSDAINGDTPAICPDCKKYNSAKLKGGPIGSIE